VRKRTVTDVGERLLGMSSGPRPSPDSRPGYEEDRRHRRDQQRDDPDVHASEEALGPEPDLGLKPIPKKSPVVLTRYWPACGTEMSHTLTWASWYLPLAAWLLPRSREIVGFPPTPTPTGVTDNDRFVGSGKLGV
jgi:hypothetical protein